LWVIRLYWPEAATAASLAAWRTGVSGSSATSGVGLAPPQIRERAANIVPTPVFIQHLRKLSERTLDEIKLINLIKDADPQTGHSRRDALSS
jgi:hypothetical protein